MFASQISVMVERTFTTNWTLHYKYYSVNLTTLYTPPTTLTTHTHTHRKTIKQNITKTHLHSTTPVHNWMQNTWIKNEKIKTKYTDTLIYLPAHQIMKKSEWEKERERERGCFTVSLRFASFTATTTRSSILHYGVKNVITAATKRNGTNDLP